MVQQTNACCGTKLPEEFSPDLPADVLPKLP
jgi:hypothetical protein